MVASPETNPCVWLSEEWRAWPVALSGKPRRMLRNATLIDWPGRCVTDEIVMDPFSALRRAGWACLLLAPPFLFLAFTHCDFGALGSDHFPGIRNSVVVLQDTQTRCPSPTVPRPS